MKKIVVRLKAVASAEKSFSINMAQFKKNWKVYSDNVFLYEMITNTGGKFFTRNPEPYVEQLNGFNIFYTMR
jgi:hypothetical protein